MHWNFCSRLDSGIIPSVNRSICSRRIILDLFRETYPEIIEDEDYFLDIVYGVINSRDELDEKFVPFLKRWKLERLPVTDRIILEIAVYEILTVEDIPTSVSINEAVKLAKKFGTDSSSSYINGVLSNFVKSI